MDKKWSSPYINHFLQPDSLIPDYTNPQAWNRYSYVANRPINFSDPSGHNAECGLGEYGCSAGTYNPPPDQSGSLDRVIASYGITTSGFARKEKWAILRAARMVGGKFAEQRGNGETAAEAFNAVYTDGININQGGTNATGQCADASSGGCTSSRNQINFWAMSGHNMYGNSDEDLYDFSRMIKNVIHEFGHAFALAYRHSTGINPVDNMDALTANRELFLRPNCAFPCRGPNDLNALYLDWQQHPKEMNTPGEWVAIAASETFGDMFIAWTYGAWNTSGNSQNVAAVNFAQKWMNGLAAP